MIARLRAWLTLTRIERRLAGALVAPLLGFGALWIGVEAVVQYRAVTDMVRREVAQVVRSVTPGVEAALWDLDYETIAHLLASATVSPSIVGAEVRDDLDRPVAEVGAVADPVSRSLRVALRRPDRAEEARIGALVIHVSAAALLADLRDIFLGVALGVLAMLVLLMVSLVLVVRRSMVDPLVALHASIWRAAGGDRFEPVAVRTGDELGEVVAGYNALMGQLAASRAALLRRKGTLERLVRRRTDVIERQKTQVEQALARERELGVLQRQFVAMVSHEFRTPLAIIDGRAQQLSRRLGRELEPEPRAYVESRTSEIRASVLRLTQLIESVLTASRFEDGRIALEPREADLRALLQEVRDGVAGLHPDRNFALTVDPRLDRAVFDPVLLRQVAANLVGNAAKYSDAGASIAVAARRDDAAQEIEIAVSDTGLGVPPEEVGRLFERFYRASSSIGRPGTGIGLHLAAAFVAMHGGRIEVESVVGEGSTFRVRLPATLKPVMAAA